MIYYTLPQVEEARAGLDTEYLWKALTQGSASVSYAAERALADIERERHRAAAITGAMLLRAAAVSA